MQFFGQPRVTLDLAYRRYVEVHITATIKRIPADVDGRQAVGFPKPPGGDPVLWLMVKGIIFSSMGVQDSDEVAQGVDARRALPKRRSLLRV
jgi:hypothetical protein